MTTESTETPSKRSLGAAGERRHKVQRSAATAGGSPWCNLLQAAAAQAPIAQAPERPPIPERLPTGHQQKPNHTGTIGCRSDISSLRAGLIVASSAAVPSPLIINPHPAAPEGSVPARQAARQLSPVPSASPKAGIVESVDGRSFRSSASGMARLQQTPLPSLRSLPAGPSRADGALTPLSASDPLHSHSPLPAGPAQSAQLPHSSLGSSSRSTPTRSRAFAGWQTYGSTTEAKGAIQNGTEPVTGPSQPTTPRLGSSAFVTWPGCEDPAEDKDGQSRAPAPQSPPTQRELHLAKQLEDERVINTILMQEVTVRQMEAEGCEQGQTAAPRSQAAHMQNLIRIQSTSTALTAMQQVLLAKDEEIVELQAKVKQAVDAEKARWASTFTALVASCKEPFRKLQSAVRAQETELRQLRSAMSSRGSDEIVSSGNSGSAQDCSAQRCTTAEQQDNSPTPASASPLAAAAAAKHAADGCFNPFAAHRVDLETVAARMQQQDPTAVHVPRQLHLVGSGTLHPSTPTSRQAEERSRRDMQSWSLTTPHAGSFPCLQLSPGHEDTEAAEPELQISGHC